MEQQLKYWVEIGNDLTLSPWASIPFLELKQKALHELQSLKIPSKKNEDWKYCPTFPGTNDFIEQARPTTEISSAITDKSSLGQVVFSSGFFLKNYSSLPEGIKVYSLREGNLPKGLEDNLSKIPSSSTENFYEKLNLSSSAHAYIIEVEKDFYLKGQLNILHFSSQGLSNPWILVVVGKNSQIDIIERFVDEQACFTNSSTNFVCHENAKINYLKDIASSDKNHLFSQTKASLEKNASFEFFSFSASNARIRQDITIDLKGKNAQARLNALVLANKDSEHDFTSSIRHSTPFTNSSQLFKTIINGEATVSFTGKIFVLQHSQQISSEQLSRALLLSKKAQVNARPVLFIDADDVKCSHGSTVGQLDQEQEFYLRSRGISSERAKTILCEAFSYEMLDNIASESLGMIVKKKLKEKLPELLSEKQT